LETKLNLQPLRACAPVFVTENVPLRPPQKLLDAVTEPCSTPFKSKVEEVMGRRKQKIQRGISESV
jgi:hypothetical protein